MKLFLTSNGLSTEKLRTELQKIIAKPRENTSAVFIPTAADLEEDQWWVEASREDLHRVAVDVKDIDLKKHSKNSLEKEFQNADIICVGGGNTFYLLYWCKRSGLKEALTSFFERGGIYVGISAGTILCSPTIELAGWEDADDPSVVKLDSIEGMNFTDKHFFVHYQKHYDELIEEHTEVHDRLELLLDGSALYLENDTVREIVTF
jgi:dipeptidase E